MNKEKTMNLQVDSIEIMAVPLHVQVVLDYMQMVYSQPLKVISTPRANYQITFAKIPKRGFYPFVVFREHDLGDYWRVGADDRCGEEVVTGLIARNDREKLFSMIYLYSYMVKFLPYNLFQFKNDHPEFSQEIYKVLSAFMRTSLFDKDKE
jgi:hypothetical protein